MPNPTAYLDSLAIGPVVQHRNLTLVVLLGPDAPRRYRTLDEALGAGSARITEISAAGSVPELRLVNQCDTPVLLLDGEELIGAKQNRVLNLTILAPANASLTIPVSCVEAGRWAANSANFASADRALYARGRARKLHQVSMSLQFDGVRRSDQSDVWRGIDEKLAQSGTHSASRAMADAFENRRAGLDEFVAAMRAHPGQTGALFEIDGTVVGLDCFDCADTLSRLLPKLVRSYAMDALDSPWPMAQTVSAETARTFLRLAGEAEVMAHPAIGLGQDLRFASAEVSGAALWWGDAPVHFCAFTQRLAGEREHPHGTSFTRASRRRMFH